MAEAREIRSGLTRLSVPWETPGATVLVVTEVDRVSRDRAIVAEIEAELRARGIGIEYAWNRDDPFAGNEDKLAEFG